MSQKYNFILNHPNVFQLFLKRNQFDSPRTRNLTNMNKILQNSTECVSSFYGTRRHEGTKNEQKPVENLFSVKHPCCLPVWSGDVHHHSANEFAPAAAHLPTALTGLSLQKSENRENRSFNDDDNL